MSKQEYEKVMQDFIRDTGLYPQQIIPLKDSGYLIIIKSGKILYHY